MKKIIISIVVCSLCVSCAKNPFSTRESEPPTARAGTFIPPTTPQIVLENLRLSYSELVIGNYTQCLDSSLVFKFDFIQGAQLDTSWGVAREISLTEKMFNDFTIARSTRSLRVNFTAKASQPDVISDTTATLVRDYTVTVLDSASATIDSYQGIATFTLIESSFNFWRIVVWEDLHLNTQTRSWAELKNAYR